jgi:D-lyxose ketol-isomerase
MMAGLAAGAVGGTVGGGIAAHAASERNGALKIYSNDHFYTNGVFDAEKAKAAYYEMMDHYNYPIAPRLKGEEFWAIDFGMGKFMEIGMAGIFWVNNLEHNYFGHEIYLLPGQSIPEHKHVATALAGPKLEAWQLRHGSVTLYAEGDASPGVEKRIPPSHLECAKARKEQALNESGEMGQLAAPEQWHWMKAGPNGAIVTEYATYHDGEGLRFSHPDVKF